MVFFSQVCFRILLGDVEQRFSYIIHNFGASYNQPFDIAVVFSLVVCFCLFFETSSQYISLGWPEIRCVAKAGFGLLILLPLPPEPI